MIAIYEPEVTKYSDSAIKAIKSYTWAAFCEIFNRTTIKNAKF